MLHRPARRMLTYLGGLHIQGHQLIGTWVSRATLMSTGITFDIIRILEDDQVLGNGQVISPGVHLGKESTQIHIQVSTDVRPSALQCCYPSAHDVHNAAEVGPLPVPNSREISNIHYRYRTGIGSNLQCCHIKLNNYDSLSTLNVTLSNSRLLEIQNPAYSGVLRRDRTGLGV